MKAVNLLPPDQRGATKASAPLGVGAEVSKGPGPFLVLGVLAVGVVALAGYVLAGNTIKQREADLATLSARHQAVQAKAEKLKPYADFDVLASSRVATVKDLAGRRFDWEQALRDLSRAVPANVSLKTIDGSVSVEGGTGGNMRASIAAPAIALSGCTRSQSEVARLMARLRNIDGVTRVSLSKSDKEAGASTTPQAAGQQQATVAPPGYCGRGNPPAFDMVMFFEGAAAASKDPATATQATAAPAGQPTGAQPAATPSATPSPAAGTPASTTQGGATP